MSRLAHIATACLLAGATALSAGRAMAQSPVDVGVIEDSDIAVVQKLLYPKAGRTEFGANLGIMAWDPYLTTPNLQLGLDLHRSEMLALSASVGGGYGFKTAVHAEMEERHGVAPYAYRYLGSALAGVLWSPVYAKANVAGKAIVHYDLYVAPRGGLSVEQSVIPDGGMAFAPTVSAEVGARVFLGGGSTVHIAFRDDLLFEYRKLTRSLKLKQNADLMVGVTMMSRTGKR